MAARALPVAFLRETIAELLADARTAADVQRVKRRLAAKHGLVEVPTNADVLAGADREERERLLPLLRMKPTRTLSGVAIVTVQASPAGCPHGTCTFCPGGPRNPLGPSAQSYTGREPAALRAGRHEWDPYAQTAARLAELTATGHAVDKVDFIVQGGTFPARPRRYQEEFLQRAFDAMNAFAGAAGPSALLAHAQELNERARARMIGLTVETKPDWCKEPHLDAMLALGTTRVEIGVQSVHDDQLEGTRRGHTVADSIGATRLAKDAGLKVLHHVMPGLPGWTRERDLETFRRILTDPDWSPDMIKIYPTLVMPGTPLWDAWQRGEYAHVDEAYCVDLLAEAKALVPPWMRIQRIDRDIPTPLVAAGVKKSNVRELVLAEMERRGTRCRCIRCREVGRRAAAPARPQAADEADGGFALVRRSYRASGGVEHFLSFEDESRDALAAFVRVREPSAASWRPEAEGAVFLRELRVVGREVPLAHDAGAGQAQHRGLGSRLLALAEDLAREKGYRRVAVTSGVGVREYYAKRGYARLGPYMVKDV